MEAHEAIKRMVKSLPEEDKNKLAVLIVRACPGSIQAAIDTHAKVNYTIDLRITPHWRDEPVNEWETKFRQEHMARVEETTPEFVSALLEAIMHLDMKQVAAMTETQEKAGCETE